MATRSRIGIVNEDGTVSSIYCHWDGYLAGNGKILVTHYTDREKVKALIALGSISSLCKEVEPSAIWNNMSEGSGKNMMKRMFPMDEHTFDKPLKDVTIAYHRDRGEELVIAHNKSIEEYFEGDYDEYGYLFTLDGEWLVKQCYGMNPVPRPVKEVLANDL